MTYAVATRRLSDGRLVRACDAPGAGFVTQSEINLHGSAAAARAARIAKAKGRAND